MDAKKNDRYKKKYILKSIKHKWGYYEFDGIITLVKNCILKEKYNKIYQLIFHGGDAVDGLYLINAFDINIHYDNNDEKAYTIQSIKYDKIAGYDDCTIHSFETRDELIDWLIKENFLKHDELKLINSKVITKDMLVGMERFILDS